MKLISLLTAFCLLANASAQEPDVLIPFKDTAKGKLQLHVFKPAGWKAEDKRPAIVFFFGGGWVGGSPSQFYPQARHLADKGMVAISAEYRTKKSHGTDPFACIEDGKSAIRWVRAHAAELGVNPEKIAAGGGSAGGHVAACTGVLTAFDNPDENKKVSSVPQAMVLFNPVIDTSKKGFGAKSLKDKWETASPVHNVHKGVPPTMIVHGTADTTVPFANEEAFKKKMEALELRCELNAYEGRAHGFFNKTKGDGKDYEATVKQMDAFLKSLGFLE
jgi:acetyl esterase